MIYLTTEIFSRCFSVKISEEFLRPGYRHGGYLFSPSIPISTQVSSRNYKHMTRFQISPTGSNTSLAIAKLENRFPKLSNINSGLFSQSKIPDQVPFPSLRKTRRSWLSPGVKFVLHNSHQF